MKAGKYIFLTICCLTSITCHAQVFPESDAIWNIRVDGLEQYYGLSGDTIIGGKFYSKLYKLNDTTLIPDSREEYLGGFRQEGRTVWFRPNLPADYINYDYPHYPEETVLYDFSKNVGDTIWHNIIPNKYIYYWNIGDSISASIITSTDLDEFGRKIYHTNEYIILPYEKEFIDLGRIDSWIEGVGSVCHGLYWFLSQRSVCGFPKFFLTRFKQGEEVKYTGCNSCNCMDSDWKTIPEKKVLPLEVIYENNSIWIKGEASFFPCDLKLFSPTGQIIFEKRLLSDREKIPVDRPERVLLYQIQKNKEIFYSGKIMIK